MTTTEKQLVRELTDYIKGFYGGKRYIAARYATRYVIEYGIEAMAKFDEHFA